MLHTRPPQAEQYVEFLTSQGIEPEKVPSMAAELADSRTGFDSAYCYQDDVAGALRTAQEYPSLEFVIEAFQTYKMLTVTGAVPTYTLKIHGVDQLVTTDQAAAVAAYNQAEPQSYLLTRPELRKENRPPRKGDYLHSLVDEQRRQKRSH